MNKTLHFLLSKLTKPNISKPDLTTPRIKNSFSVGPGRLRGGKWTFFIIFPQDPCFGFLAVGNYISNINPKNLILGAKLSTFTLWCQFVHGAKLSAVPNCPLLPMLPNCPGAKLSMVPNCPRCQIVHFYPKCQIVLVQNCPWCQIVRGAKLSAVPNCPVLPMVSSNCPPTWVVPNCPWCQIVLGP